jgi:acyl carrier protein
MQSRNPEEVIQAWFIMHISDLLGVAPNSIDVRVPFNSYGLSSKDMVVLSGELEVWLERQLSPTLVYEYPNIEALAKYLAEGPGEPHRDSLFEEHRGDSSECQWRKAHGPDKGKPCPQSETEPIALIGIGCRFPGAQSPQAFWQLLRKGVDAITEVPVERWDAGAFYDPDPTVPGKTSTRWGGFLEQVEHFAPSVFGIAPREAVRMDPQQRLLLEVAWEALEDAGLVLEHLAGTQTGVFIGISSNDYGQFQ